MASDPNTRFGPGLRCQTVRFLFRFPPILSASLGLFVAGCCCERKVVLVIPPPAPYSRVISSDFEGRTIAEYIAEGPVCETRCGFRFRAVERRIFTPRELEFRYPLGRPVTVAASNLVAMPSYKPCWLAAMDASQGNMTGPAPSVIDRTVFH